MHQYFHAIPLTKAGSAFDGGQFALIEPDDVAVAARINYHGAGPIMRMDVHAPMAYRATDMPLQLFRIERGGHAIGSHAPRPTLANDGGEIIAFDEKTTALLA